jgi:hypothetical protein
MWVLANMSSRSAPPRRARLTPPRPPTPGGSLRSRITTGQSTEFPDGACVGLAWRGRKPRRCAGATSTSTVNNSRSAGRSRGVGSKVSQPSSSRRSRSTPSETSGSPRAWSSSCARDGRGAEFAADDDLVFGDMTGQALRQENVRRRVLAPAAKTAEVSWIGFHTFRHTAPRSSSRRVATRCRSHAGSGITRPLSRCPFTGICSKRASARRST